MDSSLRLGCFQSHRVRSPPESQTCTKTTPVKFAIFAPPEDRQVHHLWIQYRHCLSVRIGIASYCQCSPCHTERIMDQTWPSQHQAPKKLMSVIKHENTVFNMFNTTKHFETCEDYMTINKQYQTVFRIATECPRTLGDEVLCLNCQVLSSLSSFRFSAWAFFRCCLFPGFLPRFCHFQKCKWFHSSSFSKSILSSLFEFSCDCSEPSLSGNHRNSQDHQVSAVRDSSPGCGQAHGPCFPPEGHRSRLGFSA